MASAVLARLLRGRGFYAVAQDGVFLIFRNRMKSETTILRAGLTALASQLPPGWTCDPDGPGFVVIRAPDGTNGRVAVQAKARVPPGEIATVAARLDEVSDAAHLVFAGWLSPTSRELLSKRGIGFVDLTGNVELRLSRPGLFMRASGAAHDPEPTPSGLKSLKGAGTARAVRALVDFEPPYGVRELAGASGASASVVSRVAALLEAEGLVARDRQITDVDWETVLRRWAEDYGFTDSNRVVACLEPRGLPTLVRKLTDFQERWSATLTLGVPTGVAVVPLRLAAIYVEYPERVAEELSLSPTPAGGNVLLVEPPDDGPFARAERGADGVVRCAPSQVVADLLTGPGRGSAEAEALLGWMRDNVRTWRSRP